MMIESQMLDAKKPIGSKSARIALVVVLPLLFAPTTLPNRSDFSFTMEHRRDPAGEYLPPPPPVAPLRSGHEADRTSTELWVDLFGSRRPDAAALIARWIPIPPR